MKNKLAVLYVIAILSLLTVSNVLADDAPVPSGTNEKISEQTVADTLKTLISSRRETERALKQMRTLLPTLKTDEEKQSVIHEIDRLKRDLAESVATFQKIATGTKLDEQASKPEEKLDLKKEAEILIAPILQQLKKLTERPRLTEKLRTDIDYYNKKIGQVKQAQVNLKKLQGEIDKKEKTLTSYLKKLEGNLAKREKQLIDKQTLSQYNLNDLEKQATGFWDSGQAIIKMFFKSRGKNLLLACFAFVFVFVFLRYFHRIIYRVSPIHKKVKRSLYIRVMDILYYIFIVIGSFCASFFVLYISGDWMLLCLFIVFMIGIAWTAKAGLMQFWKQVQLMLNIGMVREDERIIYNGIPWKVVSLNFQADLENPALTEPTMRLSLKKIQDLSSRKYHRDEPWFPSSPGDWVILSDGTRGKAHTQSPDIVTLSLPGGGIKTYMTSDYLSLSPANISKGFRLRLVFGLDYKYQGSITTLISETMKTALKEGLVKYGYGEGLKDVRVEMECAAASSLDMMFLVDYDGASASCYKRILRCMNRIAIEACNENDWEIPFTQLTVHNAGLNLITAPES